MRKIIKKSVKCEQCGEVFENFARNNGTKKRFCEMCLVNRFTANAKKRKEARNVKQ